MQKIHSIAFLLILLIVGCNSAKITTSWTPKNITPHKFNKILVLGIIHDNNRLIQERMEQHLVGDLIDLGYNAISALAEFGPKAFDTLDVDASFEKVKSSGADAVMTIVLLHKKRESKYVEGQYIQTGNLSDYVWVRNNRVFMPGHYITETKYFWESNLYEMNSQTLLYSVQTKYFSPSSIEKMGHEYGKKIIGNLVAKNVLKSQKATIEDF